MAFLKSDFRGSHQMPATPNAGIRVWIYVLVAAGCAIALVAIYVAVVGAAASFTVSTDGQHWANFADYLAGTLGPALSFLAFIAVLWTVSLQRMQLNLMQESRVLEEMQRLLANLYDSIQGQLREDISSRFRSDGMKQSGYTLYKTLIAYAQTVSQHKDRKPEEIPTNEASFVDDAKVALATPAVTLTYELSHFTVALDRYASLNGSPDVIAYYVQRFQHVVRALQMAEITNIPARMTARFTVAHEGPAGRATPHPVES